MEHEPDEDGLDPLDVPIPDDTRELDREVHAYRRELRWQRVRERLRGWTRAARDVGTPTVLVAGVLLLASVSAAFLMLGVRLSGGEPSGQPPPGTSATASGPARQAIGEPLPDIAVRADGEGIRRLRELHASVLLLAPPRCDCFPAMHELAARAREHGIPAYVVESGSSTPERDSLAARLGGQWPRVLEERSGVLARRYGGSGLTAVLVDHRGVVSTVMRRPAPGTNWQEHLAALRGPGGGQ